MLILCVGCWVNYAVILYWINAATLCWDNTATVRVGLILLLCVGCLPVSVGIPTTHDSVWIAGILCCTIQYFYRTCAV